MKTPGAGREFPGSTALSFAALAALLLAVAWPLLDAGLFTDDWLWLALARHLEHPFAPYVNGVLHEYLYRPTAIAFWWLSERLVGTSAPGHYAVDIAIHLANAWLLARLLRAHGRPIAAVVAAAAIFSLLPGAFGSVLWLSNRYELLAMFFGLSFLLALERDLEREDPARRWPWIAVLLALSLSAKESGLVFAAAGAARLLLAAKGEPGHRRYWLSIALPVIALFLMRKLTILPVSVNVTWEGILNAAPPGIWAWLKLLPAALSGFAPSAATGIVLPALLIVLSLVCVTRSLPAFGWRRDAALIIGATLLLVPPLLQWPVTHFVLADATASTHLVNLRFYYLSTAGIAVLATGAYGARDRPWFRAACALAFVVLACFSAARSWRMANEWRDLTAANDAGMRLIAAEVLRQPADFYAPGCRILLRRTQWPGTFGEYADVALKAIGPRGHPMLQCVFFAGERAPWHALLRRDLCSTAHWPGLTTRHSEPFPLIRPFGNLCLAGFHAPPPDAIDRTLDLDR